MEDWEVESEKGMEKKRLVKMQAITALFSLVAALGVISIGYLLVSFNRQVDELFHKIEYGNLKVEINEYEDSKREEKNRLIFKYILKLIYGGETVRDELLDILTIFYPDDTQHVMQNIDLVLNEYKTIPEYEAIPDGHSLTNEPPDSTTKKKWAIVVGSDKSIDAAKYEVWRARNKKYSPKIFKKGHRFVTIIGPFNNLTKVEKMTPEVRKSLNKTSYVINYHAWCKQRVERDQYIECGVSSLN